MVGLPSSFNEQIERLTTYIEENAEVEKTAQLSYSKTLFISSFPTEIKADDQLSNVEWYKQPGGIHLKGRACLVRKGIENLWRILLVAIIKIIFL